MSGPDLLVPATENERRLPPPMGIQELQGLEDPKEDWLVRGLIPAGGNVLVAGYPKTFKTMFLLELGVALTSGFPFLGRYEVPERRRVGIVLMEDQAHRVRRRLERLCLGKGTALDELDGWLNFWFRPPLRLNDQTVRELGEYAAELNLEFLAVDSWSYVASGDSNSADEVTPQLQELSLARVKQPGLTVQLTHHARKSQPRGGGNGGSRLTDEIRNSGAFGAWYDTGIVLARTDEQSPVRVRSELRDFPTPDPFSFVVTDQHSGDADHGQTSGGWLRLIVDDQPPEAARRVAAWQKLTPKVRDFLERHPEGVSRTKLRTGVRGGNGTIDAAFSSLVESGEAEYVEPPSVGHSGICRLIGRDPAQPCLDPASGRGDGNPADPAPPLIGGGGGLGQGASIADLDVSQGGVTEESRHGSPGQSQRESQWRV